MQPRVRSPHPNIEYFLDATQEAGELDACSAMTLRLYGDDAAILPIVNSTSKVFSYKVRRQTCLMLASMADDILFRLPRLRCGGLVRAGLSSVVYQSTQMAETFSNWAIDDEIEGGDLLPFKDHPRGKNGVPYIRTARRLHAPRFIRKYVKAHAPINAGHLRALADIMFCRAERAFPQHDNSISADWRRQIAFSKQHKNHETKQASRRERKNILRALKTAVGIVGQETVTAFLRGEDIKLIGQDTILVLHKRGTLSHEGYGSLSIGLADRNGTRLADLCTFVEGTPTLDQLSGFALWMQAGAERDIIEAANIIDIAPEGKDSPLLVQNRQTRRQNALADLIQQVGSEQADRIAAMIGWLSKRKPYIPQISYEQHRARDDAYWEKTKGHWIEAMLVFVVGYRRFPILKTAGLL